MKLISTVAEMREVSADLKRLGETLTLVPTMGYLHAGHGSLVKIGQELGSKVVVYIYVNQAQFNNKEDFDKYPRDLDRDIKVLTDLKTDYLFAPEQGEIFAKDNQTKVTVSGLSDLYEGAFRPGHFDGVSTVLTKFFTIVAPDFAVFGEKDFQQLRLVEKFVEDLKFNLKIVRGPTVREESGLAMSSRNVRLSPQGRETAAKLSKGLFAALDAAKKGERDSEKIKAIALGIINSEPAFKLEYLDIIEEQDFQPRHSISDSARMILAAWIEGVRLIDNVRLS